MLDLHLAGKPRQLELCLEVLLLELFCLLPTHLEFLQGSLNTYRECLLLGFARVQLVVDPFDIVTEFPVLDLVVRDLLLGPPNSLPDGIDLTECRGHPLPIELIHTLHLLGVPLLDLLDLGLQRLDLNLLLLHLLLQLSLLLVDPLQLELGILVGREVGLLCLVDMRLGTF